MQHENLEKRVRKGAAGSRDFSKVCLIFHQISLMTKFIKEYNMTDFIERIKRSFPCI